MKCCFLILLLLTIGCDNSHLLEKNLQEYQQRMANVLDADSKVQQTISLPPYPHSNSLKQNIAPTTIKLFEFYELKHCQLYSLVAKRNTSLGNLQLPSTRYIYERNLLEALQHCIESTTDLKLREKLKSWKQTKIQQLPMTWVEMLQLSTEVKQGLSSNQALVKGNNSDGLSQTKSALHYLLHVNQVDMTSVNQTELEQHLQNLMNTALPAKLWLSQLTLTKYLSYLTIWLTHHTEQLKCKNSDNSSKNKIEYLSNVFQRFFIQKIQPVASQINHYHYQLSPSFKSMATHSQLSPSFKNYIHHLDQRGFENYQLAMQQHIQFWQALLKRCNIPPGNR